jgi:hypothetical protein
MNLRKDECNACLQQKTKNKNHAAVRNKLTWRDYQTITYVNCKPTRKKNLKILNG